MRRLRFIANQPYEVLGAVRNRGDMLEVTDDVAEDLLRHHGLFEDADASPAEAPE